LLKKENKMNARIKQSKYKREVFDFIEGNELDYIDKTEK